MLTSPYASHLYVPVIGRLGSLRSQASIVGAILGLIGIIICGQGSVRNFFNQSGETEGHANFNEDNQENSRIFWL